MAPTELQIAQKELKDIERRRVEALLEGVQAGRGEAGTVRPLRAAR